MLFVCHIKLLQGSGTIGMGSDIIAAKSTVSITTFVFDFIVHGSISDRVDARCNIINTSRDEEVHREGGAVEVLLVSPQ